VRKSSRAGVTAGLPVRSTSLLTADGDCRLRAARGSGPCFRSTSVSRRDTNSPKNGPDPSATAVKDVLGDELERAYPGYNGQDVELAGLFWFHGIADGNSLVKSAVYERHLANLIRDLRKDLNVPDMPVVVAALSRSGEKMTPAQQQVFDAQMAVADKSKYPEFSGNVTSIDTRPMCRDPKQSPGGRDRYRGNAESYLEIGDAMGQAMLKLLQPSK